MAIFGVLPSLPPTMVQAAVAAIGSFRNTGRRHSFLAGSGIVAVNIRSDYLLRLSSSKAPISGACQLAYAK